MGQARWPRAEMASNQIVAMKNILRIGLFVGALFLMKLSGRAFMLSIIVETPAPSFLPSVAMVIYFIVGVVALFAAFGEQHFSNAWLVVPAVIGLSALVLSDWNASCGQLGPTDLTYNAYYCTHPEMKWVMSGVCAVLLLIVILRKFTSRSLSEPTEIN